MKFKSAVKALALAFMLTFIVAPVAVSASSDVQMAAKVENDPSRTTSVTYTAAGIAIAGVFILLPGMMLMTRDK